MGRVIGGAIAARQRREPARDGSALLGSIDRRRRRAGGATFATDAPAGNQLGARSSTTRDHCPCRARSDPVEGGGARAPRLSPASYGLEHVELRVASHPKQMLGPLTRVASGGELSRIALAIQVVTSEVGQVPTLIFDEVDTGIGGAVAATVGRELQALGTRRQVLCVTHLAQVAAHADHHFRVAKNGNGAAVATTLDRLKSSERVDELARMLSGAAITTKTRAHAKELFEQHRRTAQ